MPISFYIGCETGSGMIFEDEASFIAALQEKIQEAKASGQAHFDITIETVEC